MSDFFLSWWVGISYAMAKKAYQMNINRTHDYALTFNNLSNFCYWFVKLLSKMVLAEREAPKLV